MFEIPGVRRDASALTIHSESGHLWAITDDRVRLVEFTDRGEFIKEVKLTGFKDTEGLCHLGGNRFLVAEENKMRITLVDVPPDATEVNDEGRRIELDVKSKKNKGLEGVSYDRSTDTLFAVREDHPPTVYRIQRLLTGETSSATPWSLDLEGLDDLSDVFFDPSTGWLWLLSHESQTVAAFDSRGARAAEMCLKKGHHGLLEDVEQAEGIVRDRHGSLLICSEPNLIYRFQPIGDCS
jgi:uncharacterized protein YjiK